jgi:hypothetical protein
MKVFLHNKYRTIKLAYWPHAKYIGPSIWASRRRYRPVQFSGKAVDFYSVGSSFEFRPGHPPSWQDFVFLLSSIMQMPQFYLHIVTKISLQIICNYLTIIPPLILYNRGDHLDALQQPHFKSQLR